MALNQTSSHASSLGRASSSLLTPERKLTRDDESFEANSPSSWVERVSVRTDREWKEAESGMYRRETPHDDFSGAKGTYFVIGGSDGSNALASAEIFDPSIGRTGVLPKLDRGLMGHSAVTLG